MFKGYKYRLLPTAEQRSYFHSLFGAGRFVYNLALETKKRAWDTGRHNYSAFDLMRQLTELKHTECQWLKDFPAQCLASEITNLSNAFNAFYKGRGYPNYKKKFGRQSITYRQDSKISGSCISLTKIGLVKFIKHRQFPEGEIRSVVVSREPSGSFFVSILLKVNTTIPKKKKVDSSTAIGIDMGLKTFATLSDGQTFENPKYLRDKLKHLRIEQRKLNRRYKKGVKICDQSKRWHKQKLVVAKLHEKIANKRKDFLHKTSTAIIKQYDTVCLENLNIEGMIKNRSLSRAISDVSWSEFLRLLEYKAEWNGKNIIRIGRFQPSSKTCSSCGWVKPDLMLSQRSWVCKCGIQHDRDLNAALNIKRLGLEAKPSTVKVSH